MRISLLEIKPILPSSILKKRVGPLNEELRSGLIASLNNSPIEDLQRFNKELPVMIDISGDGRASDSSSNFFLEHGHVKGKVDSSRGK